MINAIKRLFGWKPPVVETRTSKDGEDLTEYECGLIVKSGGCSDCGGQLLEGPSGGCSTNYYCSNVANCGSRFNLSPFGGERITDRSPNGQKT